MNFFRGKGIVYSCLKAGWLRHSFFHIYSGTLQASHGVFLLRVNAKTLGVKLHEGTKLPYYDL